MQRSIDFGKCRERKAQREGTESEERERTEKEREGS